MVLCRSFFIDVKNVDFFYCVVVGGTNNAKLRSCGNTAFVVRNIKILTLLCISLFPFRGEMARQIRVYCVSPFFPSGGMDRQIHVTSSRSFYFFCSITVLQSGLKS